MPNTETATQTKTECCGMPVAEGFGYRYCPKCGWECRITDAIAATPQATLAAEQIKLDVKRLFSHFGFFGAQDETVAETVEYIAAAIKSAEGDERERCCKAVCCHCFKGDVLRVVAHGAIRNFVHDLTGDQSVLCGADSIRSRVVETEKGK